MSLLTTWTRRDRKAADRRRRTFNPSFQTTVENLEARTVLSAAAASVAAQVAAPVPVKPTIQSVVQLTGFTINNVVVQAGQLVANATATLNVAGQTVTQAVAIPLSLTSTPGATAGATPILHLSLGPVNLNLLGLNVKLDNCNNGPVTVDITADPNGGLLGALLTDVANLLNNGGPLGGILGGLTGAQTGTLTSGLTDLLNGVLANLHIGTGGTGAAASTGGSASAAATPAANTTDILNLHLDPLHLNLLGLHVDTSAICLDVSATAGNGKLLGNLLTSLSNLLNNTGNNFNAITVLERNILRVLNQL